ncbi:dehydrogenase/reductase SDR family member 12 isoform X1 [Callithrix jacchus]
MLSGRATPGRAGPGRRPRRGSACGAPGLSLYRSAVRFVKGLREYTKSAVSRSDYESASKDFLPNDLEVQVPGRVFLVTRGNSSIGKATALEIAKREAPQMPVKSSVSRSLPHG